MSGGIKESYVLPVIFYLICTDMLSNSACFRCCNVSVSDSVKNRCFSMVNVTHYYYDRASGLEIFLIFAVIDKAFLYCNDNFLFDLCTEFLSNKRGCIKIDFLIYSSHHSETHKLFDNFGSSLFKSVCKLTYCNAVRNHNFNLLFSCTFKLQTAELFCL